VALVQNHMKFADVQRMKDSTLKRFLRLDHFDEHLALHRLDVENSNRNLESYEFTRAKLNEHPPEILKPPRLINGEDLIAAGYAPGPQFSEILKAVEDAQLEGEIGTREEALAFVAQRWPVESAHNPRMD
jgi:poly(A) polymerase